MARKPSARTSGMKTTEVLSHRLHFAAEEKRLPWLPLLLDAYAIVDAGLSLAIGDVEKQGRQLACAKGCSNCCRQQKDVPLFPHELVGIYWYAMEQMTDDFRARLLGNLTSHEADSPCPFLIGASCSIHPVRPMGCRQFNVFSASCAPGEDPYYTRREDVLTPLADYTDRALEAVIHFYNVEDEAETARAVAFIRSQMINLQSFDWRKLAANIAGRESV